MVDLLRDQRIENWRERFALWDEPRPVPENFENLFGTEIEVAVEISGIRTVYGSFSTLGI